MDKTGRNGIRVGDIELADFKERYRNLADKHEAMIAFYDVDMNTTYKKWKTSFLSSIEVLKSLQFIDSEEFLNNALKEGKSILAEGAQGSLLDIDFGTYPFVTSSNTTAAGACTGFRNCSEPRKRSIRNFQSLHHPRWKRPLPYGIV